MQGKTINGYTLQQRLGVGGMAEVWLAENAIGKKAAVKLLLPKFCNDEAIVSRFENEAKVMVQLDHPNIRQVYDYGNIENRPTIIMEYLEGNDLKALMKSGRRFDDDELRKWWNQIVDALNYTHAKGVVHRDIKPSNIFIDEKGDVKLLDFGIAKLADTSTGTMTGSTLGTRIYMSPEQVKDPKRVDYRTDLYSLAVTFVHLLKGKAPYDSTTSSDFDIQLSIVTKPLDLSTLPESWRGFLEPYLEKEPDNRPELRHFEEAKPVKPHVAPVADDDEGTVVSSGETHPSSFVVPPMGASPAASDDEGTVLEGSACKAPSPEKPTPVSQTNPREPVTSSSEPAEEPKKKVGLWVALGAVAVAAVALLFVLLNKPEEDPSQLDPDTIAYHTCYTISDYRAYLRDFGRNGRHYDEVKAVIDRYVADSIEEAQAQQQAAAEAQAEAERMKQEQEENERKQLLNTIGQEYIKLLDANAGSDGYFLYDIDRNGIPELWIKTGTCEADYMIKVYNYNNGIRLLYSDDAGHCSFHQGNGYILKVWGQMGAVEWTKISYNGKSMVLEEVFSMAYAGDEEGDEVYKGPTEKYISLYALTYKQPILSAFKMD